MSSRYPSLISEEGKDSWAGWGLESGKIKLFRD